MVNQIDLSNKIIQRVTIPRCLLRHIGRKNITCKGKKLEMTYPFILIELPFSVYKIYIAEYYKIFCSVISVILNMVFIKL